MTKIITTSDDPHSRGTALIDTSAAVLTDDLTVVILDERSRDGRRLCGIELAGRINQTTERSDVLYLQDATGAAQLAAEIVALYSRADRALLDEFFEAFNRQIRQTMLKHAGGGGR